MINNFNINNFHLWTALITPFDQNGLVDYATLDTLVAEQEAANKTAFYYLVALAKG